MDGNFQAVFLILLASSSFQLPIQLSLGLVYIHFA